MLSRILYLGYYLKKLDYKLYWKFVDHVAKHRSKWRVSLVIDSILSSLRHNISLLEYFQFHFYELEEEERSVFAGTGYMYEYQLLMNPREKREVLNDKRLFLREFKDFVRHKYLTLEDIKSQDDQNLNEFFKNQKRLILKSHDGQCGNGIQVIPTESLTKAKLLTKLADSKNDLVEEYIEQHSDLMQLSPSGLNTVRIYTQITKRNEVEILGCRMRISVNSVVDNMAAGNLAAPLDTDTGKINGKAYYSDITKDPVESHPVTGIRIMDFQVPFWKETIALVTNAQLYYTDCRSIGWDVAITKQGPELIEGNHDWCKLVWQIPVQKGLKPILEDHKKAYLSK